MKQIAQVVSEAVELEFVDAHGETANLPADLTYDAVDPFAVTMVFHTGQSDVAWTFGRDLLLEGRYEPTGDGDVHVWPCLSAEGSAVTIIELCSPDGEVLVQTSTRSVNRFVARMLEVVPVGKESSLVDFDTELATLLG